MFQFGRGALLRLTRFAPPYEKEMVLTQEKLLSPKELGEIVGLSPAQVRALMNEGRLEFVEISSKTKRLTMTGWERFRQHATRGPDLERKRPDGDLGQVD